MFLKKLQALCGIVDKLVGEGDTAKEVGRRMKREGRVKMEEVMFCGMLRIGMLIGLTLGRKRGQKGRWMMRTSGMAFWILGISRYRVCEDGQE